MPPTVKGFIKSTLLDWDGRVAAMVFLPGCNLRCPICHSPRLVLPGEDRETVPLDAVLGHLADNRGWIDGLVVSGGEPTIHDGLIELLELLRGRDVPVKLDTNGTRPGVLEEILRRGLVQAVAMDVKAPPEKYDAVAGVSVDAAQIGRSIGLLLGGSVECEFRTTVCPAFHAAGDIEEIAKWIRGARRYVLQNFRPVDCLVREMEKVRPFSIAQLQKFAALAAQHVGSCVVRGHEAGAA